MNAWKWGVRVNNGLAQITGVAKLFEDNLSRILCDRSPDEVSAFLELSGEKVMTVRASMDVITFSVNGGEYEVWTVRQQPEGGVRA